MIRSLEWDSEFFGFPVVEVDLTDATPKEDLDLSQSIKVMDPAPVLLYLRESGQPESNESVNQTLLELGYECSYTEINITYGVNLTGNHKSDREGPREVYDLTGTSVTDHLIRLAYQAGAHSRFRLDSQFKKESFNLMYRAWIENSLSGKNAFAVLSIDADSNQTQGFVTLSKDAQSKRYFIGLIAVDQSARGSGIGKTLVQAAVKKSRLMGGTDLYVRTQADNNQACRFYERCGFIEYSRTRVAHYWRANR